MPNDLTQLSLFNFNFDNRIRRVTLFGSTHFSVLDVYQHYGKSGNPSRDWARDIKTLEKQGAKVLPDLVEPSGGAGSDSLVLLHQFPDTTGMFNKPTPVATVMAFLRIAQVAEFVEWEHIRTWMAEVAHERLEETANPGLGTARAYKRDLALMERAGLGEHEAAERLRVRIGTVETVKELTANVLRLTETPAAIGATISREYLALFGLLPKQIRAMLQTKNIRDALPKLQLRYIELAETELNMVLKEMDKMNLEQLLNIVSRIVKPLGDHLKDICQGLHIDRVTGQKLLKDGK